MKYEICRNPHARNSRRTANISSPSHHAFISNLVCYFCYVVFGRSIVFITNFKIKESPGDNVKLLSFFSITYEPAPATLVTARFLFLNYSISFAIRFKPFSAPIWKSSPSLLPRLLIKLTSLSATGCLT